MDSTTKIKSKNAKLFKALRDSEERRERRADEYDARRGNAIMKPDDWIVETARMLNRWEGLYETENKDLAPIYGLLMAYRVLELLTEATKRRQKEHLEMLRNESGEEDLSSWRLGWLERAEDIWASAAEKAENAVRTQYADSLLSLLE